MINHIQGCHVNLPVFKPVLLAVAACISFLPFAQAADICDFFPQECQDLQDEVDQLDAQLQTEIQQLEQSLDDEYDETLIELAAIEGQQTASALGLEQQYEQLEQADVDLVQLKASFDQASSEAKAYLQRRLDL